MKETVTIEFQYQKKGENRPSSTYLPDVASPVESAAMVPAKGDIVTLLVGSPRSEAKYQHFRVIGKNYVYTFENERNSVIKHCQIYIIVSDPEVNEPGTIIRG